MVDLSPPLPFFAFPCHVNVHLLAESGVSGLFHFLQDNGEEVKCFSKVVRFNVFTFPMPPSDMGSDLGCKIQHEKLCKTRYIFTSQDWGGRGRRMLSLSLALAAYQDFAVQRRTVTVI